MARSSGVKYPIPWILRKGVFDPIFFHLHPESLGVDGFSVKGFCKFLEARYIHAVQFGFDSSTGFFRVAVFRRSFLFHLRCAPVVKLHHPVTCVVAI